MSDHGLGKAVDLHWSDPAAKPLQDIQRYVAHITNSLNYNTPYMRGSEVIGVLYDHTLLLSPGLNRYISDWRFGGHRGYQTVKSNPRVTCTCGWKNSGEDARTRGEAHLRKMREWLDAHPEEETMAGFGGKIAWPKKQPPNKKKWKKRRKSS